MIVFPNCKINLGLQILQKRSDGFHALQTVFYPIQLKDVLEVIRDPNPLPGMKEVAFTASGLPVAGDETNNLCVKAYHLIKADFPQLPPVQMHLHKHIPMGAGLGGGSSDGAFTLRLLNAQFQLGLSQEQLINYALQLGSDCPFFILNQPCYATGRGEVMEPINLQLDDYRFVVVNPGIHVNTGWAFQQLNRGTDAPSSVPDLRAIVKNAPETWKDKLVNDFEAPVSKAHPEIAAVKQQLYDAGAVYASMSGSGSTVYGIFKKGIAPSFHFPEHFFVY